MHPRVAELRGDKVKKPNASKRKRIRARSSNKKQTQRVVAINKTMQKTKENSVIGEVTNYIKRKANSNEQTQSKRHCTDNSSNQQQIDDILDKISKSGYDSLTKEEKEFLFKAGK